MKPSAVGVFAKAPVPGKTKTRLAHVIGDEAAAALHVAFLWDTLALATQVTECVLFSAGDHEHPVLREAAAHFGIRQVPQHGEDLGLRMMNAIDVLLEDHATAVLIGSDAPSLPPRALKAACTKPLSFGPSSDGGFYLVGAQARPHFEEIAWSTPRTLADTLAQNPGAQLLEPWFDVDEWGDLRTLQLQLQLHAEAAPKTSDWLTEHKMLLCE
jgi:rSAM/selenodomain-associated transferase 1